MHLSHRVTTYPPVSSSQSSELVPAMRGLFICQQAASLGQHKLGSIPSRRLELAHGKWWGMQIKKQATGVS